MKRFLSTAALSLLLVLPACAERDGGGTGGGGTGPEGTGRVHGTVLSGPTCPVESAESPCPDRPVSDVTVQALQGGSVSATAVTDPDGEFTMDLAPGEYLLQAVVEPGGPGMYAQTTRVRVLDGGDVVATVLLDTGIRLPTGG